MDREPGFGKLVFRAAVGQLVLGAGVDNRKLLAVVVIVEKRVFQQQAVPSLPVDNRACGLTVGGIGIDRKSVVQGKSVSVRLDLGGRRIIKKKNTMNIVH